MICSQGGDFTSFIADNEQFIFQDSKTTFLHDLEENGFGLNFNETTIQRDTFNCGIYSLLSLYYLICTKDIQSAVKNIGVNGQNIARGKSDITQVGKNIVRN